MRKRRPHGEATLGVLAKSPSWELSSSQHPLLDVWESPWGASQVVLVVKNLPANEGDLRDASLIPGLGRSPGGGHDNPLQYSCLENPTDRGAWQAAVLRVTQSWTRLKQLNKHAHLQKSLWNAPVPTTIWWPMHKNPEKLKNGPLGPVSPQNHKIKK